MLPLVALLALAQTPAPPEVELRPLAEGELQPQVCVDAEGVVHLLVLTGDPASGDLVYRRSEDGGDSWSEDLEVGQGAIALGHVRGARMTLGREGRVHVAWPGSAAVEPRGPRDESPLIYTRLDPESGLFEPPRNVITKRYGLDGGSAIAADDAGHVWIVWHAPGDRALGEEGREVWIARSNDDGATFEPERALWSEPTGACGCCAVTATWDRGTLYVLYRGTREGNQRGMYMLASRDAGQTFHGRELDQWRTESCPLSTAALQPAGGSMLGTWVRAGAITIEDFTAPPRRDPVRMQRNDMVGTGRPVGGLAVELNYPALARDESGNLLIAAMAGTRFGHESRVDWALYDPDLKRIGACWGPRVDVPAWGLVAAFARTDGSFVVLY